MNCNKDRAYESNGVCKQCRAKQKSGTKKSWSPAEPSDPAPALEPVEVADEPIVNDLPEGFGKVHNAAGDAVPFGVAPHVLEAIRCLLSGVERRLLVAVSGMPDDEAIIHAALCVQQLEV